MFWIYIVKSCNVLIMTKKWNVSARSHLKSPPPALRDADGSERVRPPLQAVAGVTGWLQVGAVRCRRCREPLPQLAAAPRFHRASLAAWRL